MDGADEDAQEPTVGVKQPGVLLDGRVQHLAELVGRQRPELLGRERLDLLGLGLVETGVVEDARGEIDQLVAGAALQDASPGTPA